MFLHWGVIIGLGSKESMLALTDLKARTQPPSKAANATQLDATAQVQVACLAFLEKSYTPHSFGSVDLNEHVEKAYFTYT